MPQPVTNLRNPTARSARPTAMPANLRMPHVFVIPPEEEQQDNPPWCYFDADELPENNRGLPLNPDIHFPNDPYILQPFDLDVPAPITRRISLHQPRPRGTVSKKLEKKQRPEAVKIIENKPSQAGRRDSDVIEVVKVKRIREAPVDPEENTKAKRSKTLKARATRALQSIKNVGKGAQRTHVKDLWTASESTPGTFKGMQDQIHSQRDQTEYHIPATPVKKGSLSRAASRSLSQIFQPGRLSRQESSFTLRVMPSTGPSDAHEILPVANSPPLSHLRYNDTNPSLAEVPSTLTTDHTLDRRMFSSLSMKRKHLNTKFSVRELHRLFSFAPSSSHDPSSTSTTIAPFASAAPSGSEPVIIPKLSSGYPDAHMEEGIFADAHFLELDSPERKLASRYHQASHIHRDDLLSTPHHLSDLDFEMRLNSLHFDSLSFDPEDFDVSMEGDVLR